MNSNEHENTTYEITSKGIGWLEGFDAAISEIKQCQTIEEIREYIRDYEKLKEECESNNE